MTTRTLGVVLATGLLGASCPAAVVTERWGVSGHVQHPNSLVYEAHDGGARRMRFDLSAAGKGAEVYRARLFFFRSGRYGSGFDLVAVRPDRKGKESPWKVVGRPLPLAGPHYRWFDVTRLVQGWLKADAPIGVLLLRKAPKFDEKAAYLEIAYEGRPKNPPKQASQVRAFYRSGQVFVTFKEVEDFAAGKEEVTWGELGKRFRGITVEGPVPDDGPRELRYRVYGHTEPITAGNLGKARLLGEAVPGSIYNTRLVPGGDFIKRRPKAVAGRLAVEPGKAMAPGFGLFVHTVRHHGAWHYAVVTAVNGVENTVEISQANATGAIEQRPAPPAPVLQRNEITRFRDGRVYHEPWYSYWAVPPQAPRPTRYDFAVGFCPDAMTHPTPLVFTRGHTWGPKPEMPRPQPRRDLVMSMSTEPGNGFWTGTNDARDTLKGIELGTWKPFTHNRQEALIRWAQKQWEVDEQQIVGSIGAWGMWEIKRADLYASIHGWGLPEVTKGFQCWAWARGAWGPPEAYKDKPNDQNPFYLQDYTRWVTADPRKELPYFQIHTGWGAHFTEMGWPPLPRFVRAMIETKRAFCMQSRAVEQAVRQGIIRFRRDRSVPAFGNCSLDDNLGEGDLKSGEPFGQVNGYLVWRSASIVDEPGLYEITVWLWGGDSRGRDPAPRETCTVDLTPRRCRRFKPEPGTRFAWMNLDLRSGKAVQTGRVPADEHGLVTVKGLIVTKGRHRIVLKPD